MKFRLIYLLLIAVGFVASCSRDKNISSDASGRGELISYSLDGTYSARGVDTAVFGSNPALLSFRYAVQRYVVLYKTQNEFGQIVQASGVVVLPVGKTIASPIISYQHGTIPNRNGAPSVNPTGEAVLGLAAAGQGYIACVPDYIGLGAGEGTHPYCHAQTEANAVLDLLRATKKIIQEKNVAYNGQLFLTGYSQGGHATMAAHQNIETKHSNEFTVAANCSMAGPYDMSGAMVDLMLSRSIYPDPFYLPFILLSYNNAYKLYNRPSDFMIAPYDTSLVPYFFQNYDFVLLNNRSSNPPIDMIKPSVIRDFTINNDHPLRKRLRENDCWRWSTQTPIKLIYSKGDDRIPFQNAINCQAFMTALGSTNVTLLKVSDTQSHTEAAQGSIFNMILFFDTIRTDERFF
jgi:hypothetical protein